MNIMLRRASTYDGKRRVVPCWSACFFVLFCVRVLFWGGGGRITKYVGGPTACLPYETLSFRHASVLIVFFFFSRRRVLLVNFFCGGGVGGGVTNNPKFVVGLDRLLAVRNPVVSSCVCLNGDVFFSANAETILLLW